jgi:uncharacterized protein
VYYHLYLTDSCNLVCKYCRGKIFDTPELPAELIRIDETVPPEINWKFDDLYYFLSHDKDAILTFIGGEPLLKPDLIIKIMREAPVKKFMLQTNGLLLNCIPSEVVNRFNTILVSIDGDQKTTDSGRGEGTYNKVMKNIRYIIDRGYKNELIARMTVTEITDIRDAVLYLSNNQDHSFSSIHWQMDANFWNDYELRDKFHSWVTNSYIPGIKQLVMEWYSYMKITGKVLKWYPFIDPVEDLLLNRKSGLRCGSGFANYTIQPDGKIIPCPIMFGMMDYYAGSIMGTKPEDLTKYPVQGQCLSCDIYSFCGGRCLYSSILNPWPKEGTDLVCSTVRVLFDALMEIIPGIRTLITDGGVNPDQFAHEKYNGCEIIP